MLELCSGRGGALLQVAGRRVLRCVCLTLPLPTAPSALTDLPHPATLLQVDRLSSCLRPQQTVINQPLEHAKPPSGDLLGASWHDIQRVRADACIEARQQELAAEAEQLPEVRRIGKGPPK